MNKGFGFLCEGVEIAVALLEHLRAVARQREIGAAAPDRSDNPIAPAARNHGDLLNGFAALEAAKLLQEKLLQLGGGDDIHWFGSVDRERTTVRCEPAKLAEAG
jgi:hypothetical protein